MLAPQSLDVDPLRAKLYVYPRASFYQQQRAEGNHVGNNDVIELLSPYLSELSKALFRNGYTPRNGRTCTESLGYTFPASQRKPRVLLSPLVSTQQFTCIHACGYNSEYILWAINYYYYLLFLPFSAAWSAIHLKILSTMKIYLLKCQCVQH